MKAEARIVRDAAPGVDNTELFPLAAFKGGPRVNGVSLAEYGKLRLCGCADDVPGFEPRPLHTNVKALVFIKMLISCTGEDASVLAHSINLGSNLSVYRTKAGSAHMKVSVWLSLTWNRVLTSPNACSAGYFHDR
jgi:hypothetical protein